MTVMMKLYIYCIIDSNPEGIVLPIHFKEGTNCEITEPIRGLEGSPVFNIPYLDIGAVVSELNAEIQLISQEDVLKHAGVIEKLMENFGVLPCRFPTTFSKKEDAILMLKEHYSDFRENLARLRNKVEFGIKVIWPADTIKSRITQAFANGVNGLSAAPSLAAASNGVKAFMKKKFEGYKIQREFEEEADRCVALVDSFFNSFATEKKLEKLKSEALLLDAHYLIDKEKSGSFKEAFARAKNAPGDLKYLFSGPWPPYNFIRLNNVHRIREMAHESNS